MTVASVESMAWCVDRRFTLTFVWSLFALRTSAIDGVGSGMIGSGMGTCAIESAIPCPDSSAILLGGLWAASRAENG